MIDNFIWQHILGKSGCVAVEKVELLKCVFARYFKRLRLSFFAFVHGRPDNTNASQ